MTLIVKDGYQQAIHPIPYTQTWEWKCYCPNGTIIESGVAMSEDLAQMHCDHAMWKDINKSSE